MGLGKKVGMRGDDINPRETGEMEKTRCTFNELHDTKSSKRREFETEMDEGRERVRETEIERRKREFETDIMRGREGV